MLYFAYGSNMDQEQMKERCSNAKYIEHGYLKGYLLVFDGHSKTREGLVANIIKSPNNQVPYVLWEISDCDVKSLDKKEGHPKCYKRERIEVPGHKEVYAYFMTAEFKAKRKENSELQSTYLRHLINGYRQHGLDESYLDARCAHVKVL